MNISNIRLFQRGGINMTDYRPLLNFREENMDKPYNLMIILGRNLKRGLELPSELLLNVVSIIEYHLRWTPTSDFFRLFPPIKRYADDGFWDYPSTLEMIEKEMGDKFGKDDFKKLLMTNCYENEFIQEIGYAWMEAVDDMRTRMTGKSVMQEFLESEGVRMYTLGDFDE